MRLALVVVPSLTKAAATTRRVSALGDQLHDRLSEPDANFRVEVLETRGRLGERISAILREHGGNGPTLVFVSGRISLADDGPQLDLSGGSELLFSELRASLVSGADDVVLVLDAGHVGDPDDPTLSATLIDAAIAAIEPKESGISLLVGARPTDAATTPKSEFARSFLTALDDARSKLARSGAVTAAQVYRSMRDNADLFHEIPAAGYFPGRREFPLLVEQSVVVGSESTAPASMKSTRPSVRPSIPPAVKLPVVEDAWREGTNASKAGRPAEAIEHYKKALLLLGQKPERAELYYRIGREKEALGSAAEAIHNYDKALGIEPLHHEAHNRASKLLQTEGDFARLERFLRRRLDARSDTPGKIKELSAIAALWQTLAGEPAKAIAALEQWIALEPNADALARLIEARTGAARHAAANQARKELAALLETDPGRRGRVLLEAATTAEKHLPGGGDALDLAKAALDADPALLEALEVAARALGSRRRWKELAELYEWLLGRVSGDVVIWDLGKKLGMLYRDELDDAERATAAFSRAVEKKPSDLELRFWLTELHEAQRDYAAAARQMRAAASESSRDANVYRRALWCFEKTGEADSAWCAANVLDHLGEADINESLLADTHRPEGLLVARASFSEAEWSSLRSERDDALESLLERVAPAAIELRVRDLEKNKRLPRLDESTQQNPSGTTTLMRSLAWTARLLGTGVPVVHVLPTVEGDLSPLPLVESTAVAGRNVASGLDLPELAFLWARVLSYLRPEHRLVIFYPTALDVAKLLLGTLALVGVEEAEGDALALSKALAELVDDDVLGEVEELARALEKKRLRTRVGRYVRGVHRAAGRAGLIACGDIARAVALVERFPLGVELEARAQTDDLHAFSISVEHARIREHLGVSLKA